MKKLFLSLGLFALMSLMTTNGLAQVAIGVNAAPNENALLDLKENDVSGIGTATKGLLLPRVALDSVSSPAPMTAHVQGMVVYNTNTSGVLIANKVSPGFYYNNGARWEKLFFGMGYTNWFYMPSIAISTGTVTPAGPDITIDLYAEYKKQFDGSQTTFVASAGAPGAIPYIPQAGDLYYYITYYDDTVFTISGIDANGVMSYKVIDAATDCSYVNIVFVLK